MGINGETRKGCEGSITSLPLLFLRIAISNFFLLLTMKENTIYSGHVRLFFRLSFKVEIIPLNKLGSWDVLRNLFPPRKIQLLL